ncbi:MAG: hypothetical protein U5N26_06825 [Candidatus Marinimicrobia bacterium]|nr:hypothetical protein [Candidatus Neomarinimicrobiota bacterium]
MNKISKHVIKDVINSILKLAVSVLIIIGSLIAFKAFITDEVVRIANEDKFLNNLASRINPYIIFDSNESYLYDGGALKYIEDIKVIHGKHHTFSQEFNKIVSPIKIIVKTNKILSFEPQISCLNGESEGLINIKRGMHMSWIFNLENWLSNNPGGIDTFRVDLIP